jgi:hypothetical protein
MQLVAANFNWAQSSTSDPAPPNEGELRLAVGAQHAAPFLGTNSRFSRSCLYRLEGTNLFLVRIPEDRRCSPDFRLWFDLELHPLDLSTFAVAKTSSHQNDTD